MLRIENLSYELHGRRLLAPLSVSFKPGQLHAIFGPNGAGKSTLLRLLAREWLPSAGSITLDDRPLGAWPAAELPRPPPMLPPPPALSFPFTPLDVAEPAPPPPP